jgi:hypothetical protein
MTASNTRSNVAGSVGTGLPFLAAGLGLAAIAGATGCHMEVLIVPLGLLALASISAVVVGVAAIRMRRSKRGLVMPLVSILTGIGTIVWLIRVWV